MKKLIMLIAAISLLPAYIFAAGNVLNDEKLDKAISQKVENAKKQKIEKENMKATAYIGMRKYVGKDDGDGLRKYIANYHKSGKHITEDDFYDIYDVKKGAYNEYVPVGVSRGKVKQHKLCYAIANNKVNVGKAIIDAGQYPKEGCRRYASKNKDYYLDINKEEVSLWKAENLDSKVEENLPVSIDFTVSENEELSCYALGKGLIPQEWLLNDKLAVPALCKEEWSLPLENLKKKKAEEEAKAKAEAEKAKAEAEAKALAERARMLAEMGLSEEKWQKLIKQKEDNFSFAKESVDILSELLKDYNNSSVEKMKKKYSHAEWELDLSYERYLEKLLGADVPKTAKENYNLVKKVLNNYSAQVEKKKAEEKKAENERLLNILTKACRGDKSTAQKFFKVLKPYYYEEGDYVMYFPNNAEMRISYEGGDEVFLLNKALLVVTLYYDDVIDEFLVFNLEGKIIGAGYHGVPGIEVKDYKNPEYNFVWKKR